MTGMSKDILFLFINYEIYNSEIPTFGISIKYSYSVNV